MQIYESFNTYGKFTKLKCCVVYGGVSQKQQEENLKRKVDILIATPGRLAALMDQKIVNIENIKIFILDEADRMLDMGFIHDIKKIIAKTPSEKQTLFFSATMPPDIAKLANTILKNPTKIEITPVSSTVDIIEQYLYYVDKTSKKDLLLHILKDKSIVSALIFTRTKHGADRLIKQLAKNKVTAQAIHGDKSQGARQSALSNFKNKKLRILIATDIASRGIDIDELTHVINYDLPDTPETYVHRIGRTGRAGLKGTAISFCDFDEKEQLNDIEKLIGKKLIEIKEHPFPLKNNFPSIKVVQPRKEKTKTEKSQNKRTNTTKISATLKTSETSKTIATSKAGTSLKMGTSIKTGTSSKTNTSSKTKTSSKNSTPSQTFSPKSGISSKKEPAKQASQGKKKYRMTADGTLKEKGNFNKFLTRGKKR